MKNHSAGKLYKYSLGSILFFIFALLCPPLSCTRSDSKASTLRLSIYGDPISLDPRIGGSRICQVFIRDLFEGLTRLDKEGKPVLAGAKNVEISQDGRTYCFTLRDTYWSTGTPVTAYDYEYSWKSALSPTFPTGYSFAFFMIKGAHDAKSGKISIDEVGIRAIDDHTLLITLAHPTPYFLECVANPLFSPIWQSHEAKNPSWAKEGGSAFVCNGPFILESWQHSAQFVLTKNPYYHRQEQIHLEKIHVAVVPDSQTALQLFEKGQLDAVGEPFEHIPLDAVPVFIKEQKLHPSKVNWVYFLELNTQKGILRSKKIRQALALGINREELTSMLLQGGETPAFSILPPSLSLIDKASEALAKLRFREKFALSNTDSIFEKSPTPSSMSDFSKIESVSKSSNFSTKASFATASSFQDDARFEALKLFEEGLEELMLTRETMEALTFVHWQESREKAVAEAITRQWQKLFRIPITLAASDYGTFIKKLTSHNFCIGGINRQSWYSDPICTLEFMKQNEVAMNGTSWENPNYLSLINAAEEQSDPLVQKVLLKEAEALLMDEMPVIPVYLSTHKLMLSPRVRGIYLTPLGHLELCDAYLVSNCKSP